MAQSRLAESAAARPRPPLFRALGNSEPPAQVEVNGQSYRRTEVFKHDSWAATALYSGASGQVVCKFNRQQPILGLPVAWLARKVARREARILRRLQGVPAIPRWLGNVCVAGQRVRTAVAHEYVPGRPLARTDRPRPAFFTALHEALSAIHQRDVACVDLHKRENILVGSDGRPYLIDFQISVARLGRWSTDWLLPRLLLRLFQRSDLYHVDKHVRRHCPPQPGQTGVVQKSRPWWISLHRCIAVPFRSFRRWLLVRCGVRTGRGDAATECFPEEAVRLERKKMAA